MHSIKYVETFDDGPAGWFGWLQPGFKPLEISQSVVTSRSPWWVDYNHAPPGAGYLHIVFGLHMKDSELAREVAGENRFVAGRYPTDFTNARITVRIKGDLDPKGAQLVLLAQTEPQPGRPRINSVLTAQPIRVTSNWSEQTITCVPDNGQWTCLGSRHSAMDNFGWGPIAPVLKDVNLDILFVLFPLKVVPTDRLRATCTCAVRAGIILSTYRNYRRDTLCSTKCKSNFQRRRMRDAVDVRRLFLATRQATHVGRRSVNASYKNAQSNGNVGGVHRTPTGCFNGLLVIMAALVVFCDHTSAANVPPSFRIVVTNSMVAIPLNFSPGAVSSAPPATVRLSFARRGSDSFQIVVLPSQDLTGVRVEASALTSSRGKIAATNVEWFVVGHTPSATKRWPDMLLPVHSFHAGKTNAWAIYVTVHAPEKAAAVKYKGTVRVQADGQSPMSVPLKATVHDFKLPVGPGNCRTTFSLQDFKKWEEGEYLKYGDYMLRHRLNPDNIYRIQPPRVSDLEHFYKQGLNYFTVCKTAKGWDLDPSRAFFAELEKSPNGAALRKMAMFYGYDEKPKETWPAMGECFRVLHETFPGVKTMTTAHVYMAWPDPVARMKEYNIDVVAPWIHPGYPVFYRFAEGEKVRAAGLELWAYNINYQTHYPLIESRLTMWEFFQQKADGWLYYSVNSWPKDSKPVDPSRGALVDYVPETPNSQGELIYEGTDGPIGSLRFANVRDGVEDYEYLWALKEKAGDVEVAREMAESVCWGILQWTSNSTAVMTARDQIADWITRPYLARKPMPGHRAKDVRPISSLAWSVDHPADVRAFEVYLGVDRESVRMASPASPEHLGRTTKPEIVPGNLRKQMTYFWRVDEITRRGVHPGYVWSLTTSAE